MKLKKKGTCTREEMAQYLARLSGMVAEGVVDFETGQEAIGDTVNFTLEVKRKKSSLELELSMKVSATQEGGGNGATKVHADFPSKKGKKGARPYRAKQLKKTLGAVWKDFKRAANGTGVVDDGQIERLRELMEEYRPFVEDAWAREWDKCDAVVAQAIDAYKRGALEEFNRLAQEVDALTKSCHKVYK